MNKTDDKANEEMPKSPSSSEQKRTLELLRRAEEAYNKHNYRWSAELYAEIYSMDRQNNLEYLHKMLLALLGEKNLASNAIIYNITSAFSNIPLFIKAVKTKPSNENMEECYEIYETMIRNNPNSIFAHLSLSKLYEKNNLAANSAEILESYSRIRKNDISTLRRIGELYLKLENIEKARAAYKRILDIKPFDQEAEKKLRDILAITSIDESKLRGSDFHDSVKDKSMSQKFQIELKVNKTQDEYKYLISEKLKEIELEPDNVPLHYELLNYYKETKDKVNILKTLEGISSISTGDLSIMVEVTEARISVFEEELRAKSPNFGDEGSLKELNSFRKKEYMELIREFPTSSDLKFVLAKINMDLKENEEAFKLFQVCSKVPELAVESMYFKGQILVRKNMLDLAVEEFKNAISAHKDMDDFKKEIIYNLGLIYGKMNRFDMALEEYKKVYREDVDFLDVAEKVEESYKKISSKEPAENKDLK